MGTFPHLDPSTRPLPLPQFPSLSSCTRCALHSTATHVGIPTHLHHSCLPPSPSTPAVLVIGQNPGYVEDRHGIPFIGPTGNILHTVYLAGISLPSLATIYLANAARCTSISDPPARSFSSCAPHLLPDILAIARSSAPPLHILCLGAPAAKYTASLFSLSRNLKSALHSQATPVDVEGSPLLLYATYHPAAILRSHNLIHAVSGHLQILLDHLTGHAPTPSTPTVVPPRSPRSCPTQPIPMRTSTTHLPLPPTCPPSSDSCPSPSTGPTA